MERNTNSKMNITEYIKKKEEQINRIIKNPLLNRNYYQMVAIKVGSDLKKRYNETFLWNQALFLSSNSAKILAFDNSNQIALKAMRLAAQIYEMLYYVSLEFDKGYSLLLSALCYDIAGYQANALCLIRDIYALEEHDDLLYRYENLFLEIVQLFMQKKLTMINIKVNKVTNILQSDDNLDIDYKDTFCSFFTLMGMISKAFLYGRVNEIDGIYCQSNKFDDDVETGFKKIIDGFIHCGNIMLTHLSMLIRTRYKLMRIRSIWDNLYKLDKLPNEIWERYLKLLSMNIYKNNTYVKEHARTSIFEFWNSQLKALEKGLISTDNSYVVQMPTSAGKTMIAEISILDSLIKTPEGKCLYIAPFRALAAEVEDCLSNHLGRLGYIISNVTGNYEIDRFDDFIIKDADVLVATPEKIDLLLRLRPDFFEEVSLIVIDEGHVLGNLDERSSLFELLITRLKRKLKDRVKFLFISAVMPDINAQQFAHWLCLNKENRITSPKDIDGIVWQPTRKIIGKFTWRGNIGRIDFPDLKIPGTRSNAFIHGIIEVNQFDKKNKKIIFPKKDNKSEAAAELAYKYADDGPVLIFCAHPGFVNTVAKAFLKLLDLRRNNVSEHFKRIDDLESIEIAQKWMGDCTLTKCLRHGIGLHYGDLAQPIRRAVEDDFRNKKLRVLIFTNTLGQGVNLPIKTIIIHSLIINAKEKRKVKIRDFWNIVGRAGRAGKETEGQIIFICNSDYDNSLFDEYSNENNIEPVNSIIYILLDYLLKKRISYDIFSTYLSLLVESELFAILVEESVSTPDENLIRNILGDSLANIQAVNLDDSALVTKLLDISKSFFAEAQDEKKRIVFSQTGLSLESCKKLYSFIEENEDRLRSEVFDSGNINNYIKFIIESFRVIDEMQSEKSKLDKLDIWNNIDFIKKFIDGWLDGVDISELRKMWESYKSEYTADRMNVFIEELLAYKFPWGATAFNLIFAYKINVNYDNMPDIIGYVPSFIKYGTNNIFASWARSLGTPTRETANKLGKAYSQNNPNADLKEFVKWYANLTEDELKYILNVDKSYEIERILYQAQKINVDKTAIRSGRIEHCKFTIRGIPFEEKRVELAKQIKVGDIVEIIREYDNIYDAYAIKVNFKGEQIGYVPRELSKRLALEIDLYGSKYLGKVVSKKLIKGNYAILVKAKKVENV